MDGTAYIIFFMIILTIVLIAVVLALISSSQQQKIEELLEQIDHTDLMAATDTQSTYRIHYKNGTTRVVTAGKKTPLYHACFQKLK